MSLQIIFVMHIFLAQVVASFCHFCQFLPCRLLLVFATGFFRSGKNLPTLISLLYNRDGHGEIQCLCSSSADVPKWGLYGVAVAL